MPKPVTPFEVHAWLDESLRARAEFGFRKALTRCVLEPQSLFDPLAPRKLRAGFLILVLLVGATVACFLYFNLVA